MQRGCILQVGYAFIATEALHTSYHGAAAALLEMHTVLPKVTGVKSSAVLAANAKRFGEASIMHL